MHNNRKREAQFEKFVVHNFMSINCFASTPAQAKKATESYEAKRKAHIQALINKASNGLPEGNAANYKHPDDFFSSWDKFFNHLQNDQNALQASQVLDQYVAQTPSM